MEAKSMTAPPHDLKAFETITMNTTEAQEAFRVRWSQTLKPLIADLQEHKAHIFWLDWLASMVLFLGSMVWALQGFGTLNIAAWFVSVFSLYRMATFVHEIVHFPSHRLQGFRWAWNILSGLPMLLPSYLYYSHLNHHAEHHYATENDPEYLPFKAKFWESTLSLYIGALLSPIFLLFRFAVLVPVSWCFPKSRAWVWTRFSSMAINRYYQNTWPQNKRAKTEQMWLEPLVVLYVWCLLLAIVLGFIPLTMFAVVVSAIWAVLFINAIRTQLTHRYQHNHAVSHLEQVEDSSTFNFGAWMTLFAPVGLRFHALHHLFPQLPYHALGTAHARLMKSELRAAAIYRKTCLLRNES